MKLSFFSAAFLLALPVIAVTAPAQACKYIPGPFLKELQEQSKSCSDKGCGQIFAAQPDKSSEPKNSCSDDPWMQLSSAISGALESHGVVIIGEQHDNAGHHKLQAAAIQEFVKTGEPKKAPGIVLEQINGDQIGGLAAYEDMRLNAARLPTLNDLKRFIGWDKTGWAKYDYDPLFYAITGLGLQVFAGDVAREAIRSAAKNGPAALTAEQQKLLHLDQPLGDKLDQASVAEIEEAHCGMLPKTALPGMAFAQRYRDANLGNAALNAVAQRGSAIVIAGNGHARSDRGIPWYVRHGAPDRKVVSVMLIEVEDGKTSPDAYVPRDPDGKPAADFIVLTPRAERGDPCEGMHPKK